MVNLGGGYRIVANPQIADTEIGLYFAFIIYYSGTREGIGNDALEDIRYPLCVANEIITKTRHRGDIPSVLTVTGEVLMKLFTGLLRAVSGIRSECLSI